MKKNGVMLVGLCGRSGSGKGYIAKMFADCGIPSVDTDAVYRRMTAPVSDRSGLSPCMTELIGRFGEQVLASDGSLNRAVMRSLVFGGDAEALADLNRITHRHILAETQDIAERLYREGADIVLIDAPVLYESGFDRMCEQVVCVTAPEDVIVSRIMKRDGLSEDDAKKRLASQKSREELEGRADVVIDNNDERPVLYERVRQCVKHLRTIRQERFDGGSE